MEALLWKPYYGSLLMGTTIVVRRVTRTTMYIYHRAQHPLIMEITEALLRKPYYGSLITEALLQKPYYGSLITEALLRKP